MVRAGSARLPGSSPKFHFNAAGRVTGGVLFWCMLLSAADSHIDHVTVAGRDLAKMQAALKSAGIATVNGGAHNNRATEMALVSFPDGAYLELIAIQPNADPQAVKAHSWAKFLNGDAGPCAWALREKDLAAEVKRLKAAGIEVSAPERAGRLRPDGVRLEWETADIGHRNPRHAPPISDPGLHAAARSGVSARQARDSRFSRRTIRGDRGEES